MNDHALESIEKKDEVLVKTEDFLSFCRYRDFNPEDPISLQLFKNYVIDHGGDLDDCI